MISSHRTALTLTAMSNFQLTCTSASQKREAPLDLLASADRFDMEGGVGKVKYHPFPFTICDGVILSNVDPRQLSLPCLKEHAIL